MREFLAKNEYSLILRPKRASVGDHNTLVLRGEREVMSHLQDGTTAVLHVGGPRGDESFVVDLGPFDLEEVGVSLFTFAAGRAWERYGIRLET